MIFLGVLMFLIPCLFSETQKNLMNVFFGFLERYQLALCKKAMEENIIVYLGTGCGKTHIAVLLMHEMRHLIKKPNKDVCVFLAPTVALVHQVSCCTFDGRGELQYD
jgi:ERCC4-related helicase